MTEGLGGMSGAKSGHFVRTVAMLDARSEGCWMDMNMVRPSGVNAGLQHSDWAGAE